ncbi:hypothetical protein [Nocardioides sp. P5_E3]
MSRPASATSVRAPTADRGCRAGAGGWVAAVGAVVVGAAHFAVSIWLGWRAWQVNIDPAHVRFPAQAPGSEPVS